MTITELIASREQDWNALEELVNEFRKPASLARRTPEKTARFAALYRATCSDLALTESYQFPPNVVERLNELVGLAYNCLYRNSVGSKSRVSRLLFEDTPRWILTDPAFWIAAALFWIPFCACMWTSRYNPSFAEDIVGSDMLQTMKRMYSDTFSDDFIDRIPMAAFYAFHNGGIGFKSFAFGLLGCVPGAYVLLTNSISLGCVFGYMTSPSCSIEASKNFYEFTRAHGPFELTALTLAASAGLRIGFGFICTRGYSRFDSVRRHAIMATPTIMVAFALFCAAGMIEAFISPNPMNILVESWGIESPLYVKLGVQYLSIGILLFYFVVLGGRQLVQSPPKWIRVARSKFLRREVDDNANAT